MADWSFTPPGGNRMLGQSGLGGFLGLGLGDSLNTALTIGLNQANNFRNYYNQGMIDQYRIPAEEAAYNNKMFFEEASRLGNYAAANNNLDEIRKVLGISATAPIGMDQWGLTTGNNMYGSRNFVYPSVRSSMYDPNGNQYYNPYTSARTQPVPRPRTIDSTW